MKPASKSSDKDRKDIDKAMRRVKEASSIIEDEIDPGMLLIFLKNTYIIYLIHEHSCPRTVVLFLCLHAPSSLSMGTGHNRLVSF